MTPSNNSYRFHGQVALVSGALRGIGKAVALAFAAESAILVLVDIDKAIFEVAEEIRHAGGEAIAVHADLSNADECQRMVKIALECYGRLDIACNNAGIAGPVGTDVAQITSSDWQRVLQVNLSSTFYSLQSELESMRANGTGAIINIASVGGLLGAQGSAAYCASKHGVIGLTRAAALDAIACGVRVNAICPGATQTDMLRQTFSAPGMQEKLMSDIPIGRTADTGEIARAVLFLASSDASYIVGQALPVDGGVTVG
ncbi:SDR family NAD(P)-dependent oxidoreductase [Halomonas sp. WWR20]